MNRKHSSWRGILIAVLGRRQVIFAAPVLVAFVATGCEPVDAAEGKTPAVSDEVRTLQDAAAVEQNLIDLYAKTMAAYSGLAPALATIMAQHREHLARLRATVSYPAGYKQPTASRPAITVPSGQQDAVAALRSAESAAATAQLDRLTATSAANAQLLASIATCETLHATTLAGVS
jgi:hypothetical protein